MHPNEPKLVKRVGILRENGGNRFEAIETNNEEYTNLSFEAFELDCIHKKSDEYPYGRALEAQLQRQAEEYVNARTNASTRS